ncbi:MAG: hypothetical protein HY717_15475, partial [Planctomycetes bacterium]|nr:hypothetical protein [Planctomycetota bacterium]
MSARKKISASLARTCSLAGTCWACGHLSLAVLVALAAGIAGLAPAQDTLLYSVRGSERDEDLGISVAGLGDVDGDRAPDFVAGAEGYPWAEDRGRVLLVSGRTGAVLREWVGVEAHIGFGGAVSAAGDLDGDGITDFAAVDHREGLTITIISPRSGEAILKISAGIRPFTAAYPILAEPFDADGDATPDLALGDSGYVIGGRISVYSGKTGHEIWTRKGNKAFDGLGFSLALIGDLDGDGRRDLAAGKPGSSHAVWEDSQTPGEVVILSGADGSILRALPGPPRHFNFGEAVANAGDLDGDGLPELAIAA